MDLNFVKGQFAEEQLENAIIELFNGMDDIPTSAEKPSTAN